MEILNSFNKRIKINESVKQQKKKRVIFLLNNFKELVEEKEIPPIETKKCKCKTIFKTEDLILICATCGTIIPSLLDDDLIVNDQLVVAYRRMSHFREILLQLQGIENVVIKEEVLITIRRNILEPVTDIYLRKLLRNLKLNKYIEHLNLIKRHLGLLPIIISKELQEKLLSMFVQIQIPFAKYAPTNRNNFLNYNYVLFKFCEILNETSYFNSFKMLKDLKKIRLSDAIWNKICVDLGWTFIKTARR
jgi:hypothetical protein